MEYILMDCIINLLKNGKQVTTYEVYIRTGLSPSDQTAVMEHLVANGFIYPMVQSDGNPSISPKWASFFQGIEEEFEEFWTKDGKNCWKGSKPSALSKYQEVRKVKSKEYLLIQRDLYFTFLDLQLKVKNFDQARCHASVWLGPQKRYEEEYSDYIYELKERIRKDEDMPMAAEEPNTTTAEDRAKKYRE